jgi:hypothetical protein
MIEITKNIRAHFSMTSSFAFAWERRSNRENVPDRLNGMAISLEKRGGEMRSFQRPYDLFQGTIDLPRR